MRTSFFKATTLAATVAIVMTNQAQAADFVVSDLAITGLERVTVDSLQTTLPFRLGQTVGDSDLAAGIKALYDTGHFSNVEVAAQDGRVVYRVTERPVIAEINYEGNRLIPKEALEEGLKNAGLSVGAPLKQATVKLIEAELENQYILQGRYNADVTVKQTELDGNRVRLDIEFIEGKSARVVDINIIGNKYFSEADIISDLTMRDGSLNPLSRVDRFSQEKLMASLEALKAKYLNAGFVRFNIDNVATNIDEEKNKVFVEIKVTEGEQYKFGDVRYLGEVTYPVEEIQSLQTFKTGDGYSQAELDKTNNQIAAKFGDDGYYNAQIRPVSRIDDTNRIVGIDYYIDPSRPITVRRITFSGNHKTKDEVLRREMRQLEGALANNTKIQLSRARLMRTGFFRTVDVQTRPVPNSPDQIDITYVVEEQPSGSSSIAAGYSQSGGVTFQFDVSQNNFMGTGNRVNASFARSETRDVYNIGMTNPYFTVNGVSQSLSAYYRQTKYDSKNLSNYVLDSHGASLSYGYPIDEHQRISGGVNYDSTKVRGGQWMGLSNVQQLMEDGGTMDNIDGVSFQNRYNTYNAILGWSYSSLDRPVFPTKGQSHNVDVTLGFGDATYQKAVYQGNYYHPFIKGSTLRGYTRLGYGNNLPFYENFYAGGYGSVRGYDQSSLGPQSRAFGNVENAARSRGVYGKINAATTDAAKYAAAAESVPANSPTREADIQRLLSDAKSGYETANNFLMTGGENRGEIVGGNALATFGGELILPMPFKGDWAEQVRPVIFVEGGQVFDTTGKSDEYVDLSTINPNLSGQAQLLQDDKDLRFSAGVGATWYTPIGPISISYAKPIGNKSTDKTDKIQFQIGSVF